MCLEEQGTFASELYEISDAGQKAKAQWKESPVSESGSAEFCQCGNEIVAAGAELPEELGVRRFDVLERLRDQVQTGLGDAQAFRARSKTICPSSVARICSSCAQRLQSRR